MWEIWKEGLSLHIWAAGLGKIPSSSSYLGEGEGDGSQFPGLGVPQRKDMEHVKSIIFDDLFSKYTTKIVPSSELWEAKSNFLAISSLVRKHFSFSWSWDLKAANDKSSEDQSSLSVKYCSRFLEFNFFKDNLCFFFGSTISIFTLSSVLVLDG